MRVLKCIVAVTLSACLLFLSVSCSVGKAEGKIKTDQFFALSTLFEQKVWGGTAFVAEEVAAFITQQELVCSHTNENSQLYILNREKTMTVSGELERYLSYANEVYELTEGKFDYALGNVIDLWEENFYSPPEKSDIEDALKISGADKVSFGENKSVSTNGAKINLGGIAKGVAIGDALRKYTEADVTSAIISCSSSVGVLGSKTDGSPFKIGIRDPNGDGGSYIATIELSNSILSTSGDYERYFISDDGVRYHHILDSETGYPVNMGLRSVTVVAKINEGDDLSYIGALTDGLSTAIFASGLNNGTVNMLRSLSLEAVFVTDEAVYITSGLEGAVNVTDKGYTLQKAEVAR